MDKKKVMLLVSGISVIVLAIIGALYYYFYISKPDQQAPIAETTEVPQYGTDSPLQKKPELSPVEKTNPFADIQTNPFE